MIGLFFGSFNPIHWGHVGLASYSLEKLELQELWLILSPLNPQKDASQQWDLDKRITLINQAIRPYPKMRLEKIECYLPQPLYTWRTLRSLKLLYPNEDFALIIGSDNLLRLKTWRQWEDIIKAVKLFVYPRPGYPIDDIPELADIPYTLCKDAPLFDISSTEIRAKLKADKTSQSE